MPSQRVTGTLYHTTASLRAVRDVTVRAIDRLVNLGPEDPWLPWVDVPHVLHRGPIPLVAFSRRRIDSHP